MTTTTPSIKLIEQLSKEFSTLVNKYYSPDQLADVRAKNTASNDNTCATHDYYDANMIMDEAFQTVMKREFVFWNDEEPGTFEQNEYDTDLINEAWGKSKEAQFYITD